MRKFIYFGFILFLCSCLNNKTSSPTQTGTGGGTGPAPTPSPGNPPINGPVMPAMNTALSSLTVAPPPISPLYVNKYFNYQTGTVSTNGNAYANAVSTENVHKLLDSNYFSGTKILVETQTWFCHDPANETGGNPNTLVTPTGVPGYPNSPHCQSHLDIGYNSNDETHLRAQLNEIRARGADGVIMDWQGSTTTINEPSIDIMMNLAATTPGFSAAVIEDQAVSYCAQKPTCDVNWQIINDMKYVATHYGTLAGYLRDQNNNLEVYFFNPDTYAQNGNPSRTIDWKFVASQIPSNIRLVMENAGGFNFQNTATPSGGAFFWMPAQNMTGCNNFQNCVGYAFDALTYFFSIADKNSYSKSQTTVSGVFKGFNDSYTDGWHYKNKDYQSRYIDQQCGLTWLSAFAAQNHHAQESGAVIPENLQVITWDDYEEGTETETGIDNCMTAFNVTTSGSSISWKITIGKSLQNFPGNEQTIDHYEIYATSDMVSGSPLMADLGPVPVNASCASGACTSDTYTMNLNQLLPPGQYRIYVQAVGKPFILNHIVTSILQVPAAVSAAAQIPVSQKQATAVGPLVAGDVKISSPANDFISTKGVFDLRAEARADGTLSDVSVYVDGANVSFEHTNKDIKEQLSLTPGTHNISVVAKGESGDIYSKSIEVTAGKLENGSATGAWRLKNVACSSGVSPNTGPLDWRTSKISLKLNNSRSQLVDQISAKCSVTASGSSNLGKHTYDVTHAALKFDPGCGIDGLPTADVHKRYIVNGKTLQMFEVNKDTEGACPRGDVEVETYGGE